MQTFETNMTFTHDINAVNKNKDMDSEAVASGPLHSNWATVRNWTEF